MGGRASFNIEQAGSAPEGGRRGRVATLFADISNGCANLPKPAAKVASLVSGRIALVHRVIYRDGKGSVLVDKPLRRMPGDDAVGFESATLATAMFGLKESMGAERVYAALRADGDMLRFRASAPSDSEAAGRVRSRDLPGAEHALATGTVTLSVDGPVPFRGEGETLIVPFTARGQSHGAAVVVMPPGAEPASRAILGYVGSLIGEGIVALADRENLADLVAGMYDSRSILESIIECATEPMKVVDLDGKVRRWNQAAEATYGWAATEALGEMLPHIPEDVRLRALHDIRQIAAAGRVVRREVVHQRADETPLAIDLTLFPMIDSDGHSSGVLSIARPAVRETSSPSAGVGVPSAIARELQAPLTAIAGYAQLLTRSEILEDHGRRIRTVTALEARIGHMNDLIESLLLTDQMETGAFELASDSTDLSSLVATVLARFEQEGGARGVLVDFEQGLPRAMIDSRMFERVLRTILASAVIASTSETVEVSLASKESGVLLRITANDSVPHAERVQEMLVGNNPADEAFGAALAMEFRLAHRIVEAHGGTCDLTALPDRDMMIEVDLPVGGDHE